MDPQRNSSILSSNFLSQLISQKLNHTNYLTWKRQIVPFIKSHCLYGHLNGTTPAPPEWIMQDVKNVAGQDQEIIAEINLEYEMWMAHDQFLVAYITSTLSEEVLGGVDDELWNDARTKKTFAKGVRKGDMYVIEEAPKIVLPLAGPINAIILGRQPLRREIREILSKEL
ncbi:hypothetical protein EJ110_NYTH56828 [Nymphaea thermarum]|nr:hypothetical protein EJ110_NYTH56828 [Nymphaea thermarum]